MPKPQSAKRPARRSSETPRKPVRPRAHDAPAPAPGARLLEVDQNHDGQRLDNFLFRNLKGVPKTHVYRLLRTGQVRVNSRRCKADTRIAIGDRVRLPPVRMAAPGVNNLSPEEAAVSWAWIESRILYEDEHLLVLDKPAGLAVHSGTGIQVGIIEALRALRPHTPFLELAHRLDRGTSGCLLVARSRPALMGLHQAFTSGRIRKSYLALVEGDFHGKDHRVSADIDTRHNEKTGRRVRVVEDEAGGKAAVSLFTRLKACPGATLVRIRLESGRTHQARVHAHFLGHPIAGDDKYGSHVFNRSLRAHGLKRLFLHAERLVLHHPTNSHPLDFKIPLPDDLQAIFDSMGE